jgi:hypothetical protein
MSRLVCARCGSPITIGGRVKRWYCCPRCGPVDAVPEDRRVSKPDIRIPTAQIVVGVLHIAGWWLAAAAVLVLLAWLVSP